LLEKAGLSPEEIFFYQLRVFGFKNYHMVSIFLEKLRKKSE